MAALWTNSGYKANPNRSDTNGYDYFAYTCLEMAVGYTTFTFPNIAAYMKLHFSNQTVTSAPNYAYSYGDVDQNADVSSADALKYLQYVSGSYSGSAADETRMKNLMDTVFGVWQIQGVGYFGDSTAFPLFIPIAPAYTPVTVTKSAYTSNDFGAVRFIGSSSINMVATDTLSITNADIDGNGTTITVSGFDYTNWTSNASLTLGAGANGQRTLNNDPSSTESLFFASSGFSTATLSITIASAIDDTLDSITDKLGADINPAALYTVYVSSSFVVSGISGTSCSVNITNGEYNINNLGWVNSANTGTAINGDSIKVRVTSSSSYSTSVSAVLTLTAGNTVSDTWTVTTEPDPTTPIEDGELIPFGHSTGAIPFSDIIDFFAGAPISGLYTPPTNLGSYYRAGLHVPPLTGNANIPTSGAISFSDFRDAYTVLYFVRAPQTKGATRNTISSGGQVVVVWYIFDFDDPADWEMGYGPFAKYSCEYQYSLTVTQNLVNAGNQSIAPRLTVGTPTTWTPATSWNSAAQLGFAVEMYVDQNTEVFANGYVTMQVRHPDNPSYVLTKNVNWSLRSYGV